MAEPLGVAIPAAAAAEDHLPVGTWPVAPTADEEHMWRMALAAVYRELNWSPFNLRGPIWFVDPDGIARAGMSWRTEPVVVCLRSGRRLKDLYATAIHELRHVYQYAHDIAAWPTPEDREADAQAFTRTMVK